MAVTNDLVTDQRVHKVCVTLSEAHFDVLLIGRKLHYSQDLPPVPYRTKRIKLLFNKGMLFYACFNIRLFLILLFSKADIFTANDLDTLLSVFLAAKIRRKKIIYDSHEFFTEVPELETNPLAKHMWTKIEKTIFPRLDKVSTVCRSIADIYSEAYKVPVSVVRNVPFYKEPVHQERPQELSGKKIIIYQGAVNIGRGLELMIETMQYIDNAVFLIIGGGDISDKLTQLIASKNMGDKVLLLGRMPYSELYKYTNIADCGISLEESIGKNYYYALPNKIFDYIHAQIPFIVSDLPEMRRIAETYLLGEIITKREPKYIAQIIEKILSTEIDVSLYTSAKKELCWEVEKEALLSLYNS